MAAGLGFKDFVTGEVLTAADVDGYLMQGVWVFASAAARDAAVTSPQEGNFAYLKDTNVTTYYTGSAWANLDTTGMTNPMTTTGDTIYSSSGSTPARLGIGSTGQVLTVAAGVPSWAAPAAGGMTLINPGGTALTGASVTISSIPATYEDLRIVVEDFIPANDGEGFRIRFNQDTTANRHIDTSNLFDQQTTFNQTSCFFANGTDNGTGNNFIFGTIFDYANTTTFKLGWAQSILVKFNAATTFLIGTMYAAYNQTDAINALTFLPGGGNFTSGTVYVWGVK